MMIGALCQGRQLLQLHPGFRDIFWDSVWALADRLDVRQAANAAAFADERGQLAIINANIGLDLGCPLALGLRNYIVMTVVGEIAWEQKPYPSYNEVLADEIVRAAGGWPQDDPPHHP